METDGEGKFVSQSCSWQYIALHSESRSRRSRLLGLSLLLEHWSSWGTHHGGFRDMSPRRNPLKKFFFFVCDSFRWAKHWPWQRRRRWRSYHRSSTFLRTFVRYDGRWVRAHWSGERGRANSKKRQKRSAQVAFLCLFFSCTARRWPVRNKLFFVNGVVDGTSGERFLTITFRISSVKYMYRVYFLVVCLFFPRSRIDFQKKLDEKHKK